MRADAGGAILVIEDEETLAESIRYNLIREGYEVTVAGDGREGVRAARESVPELIILDLMLPGLGGLDILRQIRAASSVPVVIVTAKDSEADKVAGLELGADDYVTKPFSMRELVSRVSANIRRAHGWAPDDPAYSDVIRSGGVLMDVQRHEVGVDGKAVALRPKEFALLEALMRRRGRLVRREVLLDEVWGSPFFGDSKTLDVHIRRVREKIEQDPTNPERVVTVRGLGYKFVDER